MTEGQTLALSGGVGGAKLAVGLSRVLHPEALAIVVNTGDDFEHLGLRICPDLDTLLYTLAGVANRETGWGRNAETWSCMSMFGRLGGETWFRLGDKDLAQHLYRTARLRSGLSLSQVTREIAHQLEVGPEVIPMSDDPVRTEVLTDQGTMEFQRYFVYERCAPKVHALRFSGAEKARPTERFAELLGNNTLNAILICPSNPYLSIDPILAIPGVREAIQGSPAPTIAVSPIVEGNALKGPTAKLMAELGVPASAAAIARHYHGLIDGFVLDQRDTALESKIESMGISCSVTNTIMNSDNDRDQLARDVLEFACRLKGTD